MDNKGLGIKIKELRQKLGYTQKNFAAELEITAAAFSKYERGESQPSIPILIKIAKKCDVSIDWLLDLKSTNIQQNSIRTYADLIKVLVDISKTELGIHITPSRCDGDRQYLGGVLFDTEYKEFDNFLSDWNKMYTLLKNKSIDDEVYDLWLEKTLKKFNDVYIDTEEGLPF